MSNIMQAHNKGAPQCQYFVVRKKRLCRMTVRPGRNYCGEHEPQPKTEDGKVDTRVPCPNDPKHTCYISKLEKHLLICNARQGTLPAYIVHNINAPLDPSACVRRLLNEYPKEMLMQVIDKVNMLYEKYLEGNIAEVANHGIHPVVVDEFNEANRGESSLRHLRQASSLLHLAQDAGLVQDRTCYVELGAGKGQLAFYIGSAWCGPRTGSCVLAVDRAALRHKRDNKLRANAPVDPSAHSHDNAPMETSPSSDSTTPVVSNPTNGDTIAPNTINCGPTSPKTILTAPNGDPYPLAADSTPTALNSTPTVLSSSSTTLNSTDSTHTAPNSTHTAHNTTPNALGSIPTAPSAPTCLNSTPTTPNSTPTTPNSTPTTPISTPTTPNSTPTTPNSTPTTPNSTPTAPASRVRADLAHLALDRVPDVMKSEAVVGFAKHLCGVATDYALRCVTSAGSKTRGLVLATCCHHRCQADTYVGTAHLQELGITGDEFNVMLGIVSWATCGDGRSRERRKGRDGGGGAGGPRELVGRRAKALVDWGRAKFLEQCGVRARLCRFVAAEVSPENLCILATRA